MIDNAVLHHIMKKNLCFFHENAEIMSKNEFYVPDSQKNTSMKLTNIY